MEYKTKAVTDLKSGLIVGTFEANLILTFCFSLFRVTKEILCCCYKEQRQTRYSLQFYRTTSI